MSFHAPILPRMKNPGSAMGTGRGMQRGYT
jgi:hypothetical protein